MRFALEEGTSAGISEAAAQSRPISGGERPGAWRPNGLQALRADRRSKLTQAPRML